MPPTPPPGTGSEFSFVSRRTDASMPPPLEGISLWLLSPDSLARMWLYDMVTDRRFDWAMNLLILLNCVAMAYEHPGLEPGALDTLVLYWRWALGYGHGSKWRLLFLAKRLHTTTQTPLPVHLARPRRCSMLRRAPDTGRSCHAAVQPVQPTMVECSHAFVTAVM